MGRGGDNLLDRLIGMLLYISKFNAKTVCRKDKQY